MSLGCYICILILHPHISLFSKDLSKHAIELLQFAHFLTIASRLLLLLLCLELDGLVHADFSTALASLALHRCVELRASLQRSHS